MITASLDFGTTNSVAGVNIDGTIEMIPLGKKGLETKTVLFYSFEDKNFYVGDEAVEELELDTLGRYLVSLKSFLGSKEQIETTLGTTTYLLEDLISIIIRRFKAKEVQPLFLLLKISTENCLERRSLFILMSSLVLGMGWLFMLVRFLSNYL